MAEANGRKEGPAATTYFSCTCLFDLSSLSKQHISHLFLSPLHTSLYLLSLTGDSNRFFLFVTNISSHDSL
ncbi:hypothetical protein BFJ63_vAg2596 [Fusarium oxysporum f. sp. narcissi]|uniref:Uncharacterized protein n=3 Tax=Fusarium oxysporum TaxID=5507 RepID=A0A420RSR4_FUSOX|nr:hypothetical protein FocnCong_v002300 [Fusarium oxysporum f. sp. conglutinans]RKK26316.1 hypothetical protein BFJ65_g4210 [Fusarium oxysporum f. sp. cepae]RKK71828.1 hypothetical protein BFJ69_g10685 [Fusarium oxysporum]RYC94725.1 hypothetical protein BFJ63_vAg2596 [Fusarium oxysporum f. sp. narcissi]RKK44242.1 hypothetical protein BFJ66_g9619 [Fusarium oxysporum f. sp. cepae]